MYSVYSMQKCQEYLAHILKSNHLKTNKSKSFKWNDDVFIHWLYCWAMLLMQTITVCLISWLKWSFQFVFIGREGVSWVRTQNKTKTRNAAEDLMIYSLLRKWKDTHRWHLTKLPHASVTKVQTETTAPLPVFHNTTPGRVSRACPGSSAVTSPRGEFQCITTQTCHEGLTCEIECCLVHRADWKANGVFTINDKTLWTVSKERRKNNIHRRQEVL